MHRFPLPALRACATCAVLLVGCVNGGLELHKNGGENCTLRGGRA